MKDTTYMNFSTTNKLNPIPLLLILVLFLMTFMNPVLAENLKISDNKRFLTNDDNSPFFWLGDTAWQLFQRVDKTEAEQYLKDRSEKGFNVVQCVLPGVIGLNEPNKNKDFIFDDMDPSTPNEEYFKHVDWVVNKAKELGINLAILPIWGRQIEEKHPVKKSQRVFSERSAYKYGTYLGDRYKEYENIIWVLGGDASPVGYEDTWKRLAKGIKAGGSQHLMSYHISGEMSSSEFWDTADWLDFNMIQSGHASAYYDNYRLIEKDYDLSPVKPVLDGEPIYEGIHIGFAAQNGRANDHHVRVEAYWSVFSGAFGFTYGHNSIWQMYDKKMAPLFSPGLTWKNALDTPGSHQMKHLKGLMLSRPFLSRIPDQSILEPEASSGVDHLQVTRDGILGENDATYIMVYFPFMTHKYKVKTDVLLASKLRVWWYDPRTGESCLHDEMDNSGVFEIPWGSKLNTENGGPDWVLVIDDASKKYPSPGRPLTYVKSTQ